MNPLGVGKNVAPSSMQVRRLHVLVVQKLAAAHRTGETGPSVSQNAFTQLVRYVFSLKHYRCVSH
jgi:hypothetical protein